ncbi:DEAD/DEAH box helicase [Tenacibaculum singaporense]|uniref:DEAD/DEAH box helicase n=1 Tax=Tenacibaculum singaporense TaxID=2358479 RepID=A0A3S8R9F8_9FLAO|nr:DEAD/DEAH box helicase family protein [Tenacibaculum singaporense]AZJ36449.1 DEAD/DEAH box helicase [Tenacibaculum singaporense]
MIELQLTKGEYLSYYKAKVLDIIDSNKTILIDSNPGTGKTSLFVEIGIDLKNNKRKGRLIFCAPFLIIQSQFETDLKEKGYKIDLILNSSSERKTLLDTDKIICSTYQSLKHIINDLNENDIIVLDEAHSLGYCYPSKNDSINTGYFDAEVSLLLQSKSKVVLMTGTPDEYINKLFKLTQIKVKKENEKKATVNIFNSKKSAVDLAISFAESVSIDFSKDYLNTIFINSTKQCEEINIKLQELGYQSKALTSHHKQEKTYKQLVKEMTIDENINFLICTSVISTGANIKNKKIGRALVLFESNPKEIKQFSKRFRQKLDINIDVVNKSSEKGNDGEITTQLKSEFDTLTSLIETVYMLGIPQNYTNSILSDVGTQNDIIKQLVLRYLMQYSYLEKQRSKRYKSPVLLKEALDSYSDISTELKTLDTNKDTLSDKIEKGKLEQILEGYSNQFIQNHEQFSYEIIQGKGIDRYNSNIYNNKIGRYLNLKDIKIKPEVTKIISSPYFEGKLLVPVIGNYEYIKSLPETIYLTSRKSKRELNKILLTLYFSWFIDTHTEIKILNYEYQFVYKLESAILNPLQKAIFKLLKNTFEFCLKKDNAVVSELALFLTNRFSSLEIFKELPFELTNKDGFINERVECLVDALFLTKSKKEKRIQSNGKNISSVIFEKELNKDDLVLPERKKYLDLITSKQIAMNKEGGAFWGVPEKNKILSNPKLIICKNLDDDFFTLC